MIEIARALAPTFLIIALAALLKRAKVFTPGAWEGMERATYFVFFPVFLFHALATANFKGFDVWPLAYAILCGVVTMAAALAVVHRVAGIHGPAYSSVYQGAIRWNSFVAIATLQGLYGRTGITLAAVAFAAIVPLVNTLSVFVLTRHAGRETSLRLAAASVLRNPLVLACLLGIAANAVGLPLPGPLNETLKILADASVTLGLFTVGAGLDFMGLVSQPRILALTAALKLFAMPLFMAGYCVVFGVSGPARAVAIVADSVPTATNAYILARQMGGDSVLMANIVTFTTLLAFVTMPVMVWALA